MSTDVSVWLLPEESQMRQLQTEVDCLSQAYQSESFLPHLTLFYLGTALPVDDVVNAAKIISKSFPRVTTDSIEVSYSDIFSQTLYVKYQLTDQLNAMVTMMNESFDPEFNFKLVPHLSLVYSTKMTADQKRLEAGQVQYPKTLTLDRIAIITKPGGTIAKESDVKLWQLDQEYKLQ